MNKVLENIAYKMFYSCEKATLLIEKKASAESLSIMENTRLSIHLAMCKFCRAYSKKVALIDTAMSNITKKENKKIEESEMNDFINYLQVKTFK